MFTFKMFIWLALHENGYYHDWFCLDKNIPYEQLKSWNEMKEKIQTRKYTTESYIKTFL